MEIIRKNLPNLLTLARISLIPIFVIVYYLPFEMAHVVATVLFAIAGFTDLFDGYLARRWHIESDLGAFLDPIADKLLVVVALLIVVDEYSTAMLIPIVLIIAREIVVSGVREFMAGHQLRNSVAVNKIGKFKTVIQMIAVGSLIFYMPGYNHAWVLWFGYISIYFAAILTVWSMSVYLLAAWKGLKEHRVSVLS